MRFLHTSDLHIGKTVCGFSMLEEQRFVLEQILQMVTEQRIDVVLLAGDMYDRALPPSQAVTLLGEFLTRLAEAGVMVCAIAGNHDSGERIGFANRILARRRICLEGLPSPAVRYADWTGDGEAVRIHMLPFFRPAQIREFYGESCISHEDCTREMMRHVEYLEGGKNILLTHQFVVNNGQEPELSDSEARVSVGGADCVEASNFGKFDYVALGHIHRLQKIGDGPVYYSGSPVKYSFSEAAHEKAVLIGEWDEKDCLQLVRMPLKPVHDMRRIKGRLQDLILPEVVGAADAEDYILAVLTNREALADPIGTLRSVYPNIMQLQIEREAAENHGDFADEAHCAGRHIRSMEPEKLFGQFYLEVTGEKLTPEQEKLVAGVAAEAKERQI